MKICFPSASIRQSIRTAAVGAPILILLSYALWRLAPYSRLCLAISLSSAIIIYFWPSFLAYDISDRLSAIKKLKAKETKLSKIKIKHQSFWTIFIINLIFGWSILGWVIAFGMAHNQSDSNIPTEFQKIFQTENTSVESLLVEVNVLLSKGLISKEEANTRREVILKTIN